MEAEERTTVVSDCVELVLPEGASERGHLVKGELRSADHIVPDVLVQFSRLSPHTRKASIYIYATLEQAKAIFQQPPPFSFEGTREIGDGVEERYYADEIWANYGSKMSFSKTVCFTQPSGRLSNLEISNRIPNHRPDISKSTGWFVTNRCHALEVLATPTDEEKRIAVSRAEREPLKVSLSGGSVAEIKHLVIPKKSKRGERIEASAYAVQVDNVRDLQSVIHDVSGLLILASLMSRERSEFNFWNVSAPNGVHTQKWHFGMPKWASRPKGLRPLIAYLDCSSFLCRTIQVYIGLSDPSSIDSAIYALLARDLPIETDIVSLYTGLQRVLMVATGTPPTSGLKMHTLMERFQAQYPTDLVDLWPLLGDGPSLNRIRNQLVHGRVFTDPVHFKALMIAAENLRWILERVILATLGWEIERSSVSPSALRLYTAQNWRSDRANLNL